MTQKQRRRFTTLWRHYLWVVTCTAPMPRCARAASSPNLSWPEADNMRLPAETVDAAPLINCPLAAVPNRTPRCYYVSRTGTRCSLYCRSHSLRDWSPSLAGPASDSGGGAFCGCCTWYTCAQLPLTSPPSLRPQKEAPQPHLCHSQEPPARLQGAPALGTKLGLMVSPWGTFSATGRSGSSILTAVQAAVTGRSAHSAASTAPAAVL